MYPYTSIYTCIHVYYAPSASRVHRCRLAVANESRQKCGGTTSVSSEVLNGHSACSGHSGQNSSGCCNNSAAFVTVASPVSAGYISD